MTLEWTLAASFEGTRFGVLLLAYKVLAILPILAALVALASALWRLQAPGHLNDDAPTAGQLDD